MKILVTGSTGQLGSDCKQVLQRSHDVVARNSKDLDIANQLEVTEFFRENRPDVVVNCAAYTKVDACESERDLAWRVNVDGTQALALRASEYGSKLIHISTDYVFDGRKKLPETYVEDDEVCPLSYYGQTKLEGELVVRRANRNHIIVRTSWVYGLHGYNFLRTILRLVLQDPKRELTVVNDQFGSPTWSYHLALQINRLIEMDGQGVFHATSEGHCTWYELATYFLDKMAVRHNLIPCSTDDYPTPAVRPRNSILENRRLKEQGCNLMPHWQAGIDQFIERDKDNLLKEWGLR
ncbi:MAG: dTDP-4-dehydrorhamnose reductase [Candidatus Scalindua sp. AMX11]|nr:MAG: dTDP-4-dehydrorhamnose reductase [Candidatus Scalindua sp.]NOG83955.1 dTDP-4-dehydrorhamnose reductase [Planctomycetota bacterium]RZV88027.1 MAG: dTDP-4-dehydrorhamnose reductase [Candidatus Scalindua sp. SCAELEC01]TDE63805.1 MAG: dTDP-4-dehydrorhamnose reductase [Candidatus Scalindua sp. AMX11]GJQ58395.1 MAG: NAD(P)-dependent oxidoreductase [Candidatus Scalindua sp.]